MYAEKRRERIPEGVELTVVTDSLGVAQELGRRPNLAVRLIGGRLRRGPRRRWATGPCAPWTTCRSTSPSPPDIDDEDGTAFGEAGVEVVLA